MERGINPGGSKLGVDWNYGRKACTEEKWWDDCAKEHVLCATGGAVHIEELHTYRECVLLWELKLSNSGL